MIHSVLSNVIRWPTRRSPILSSDSISDGTKARFPLGDFFSREKAKSECDWVVMSSVFVASQSGCLSYESVILHRKRI